MWFDLIWCDVVWRCVSGVMWCVLSNDRFILLLPMAEVRSLRRGCLWWCAPPCSTWVYLSRGSTGRSYTRARGSFGIGQTLSSWNWHQESKKILKSKCVPYKIWGWRNIIILELVSRESKHPDIYINIDLHTPCDKKSFEWQDPSGTVLYAVQTVWFAGWYMCHLAAGVSNVQFYLYGSSPLQQLSHHFPTYLPTYLSTFHLSIWILICKYIYLPVWWSIKQSILTIYL